MWPSVIADARAAFERLVKGPIEAALEQRLTGPEPQIPPRPRPQARPRVSNLRPASQSQNAANTRAHIDNLSRFKGVSWRKRERKWVAQICVDGKKFHLGLFDSLREAVAAYDFAAYVLFEEFARLNVAGSENISVSLPERVVTKIVETYLTTPSALCWLLRRLRAGLGVARKL
jgi:hypothetical protein